MKKIYQMVFIFGLINSLTIFAQNPIYKPDVIEQFCEKFTEGMNTSMLQYDAIFFDNYKCINFTTGNIFGNGNNDAAAIFEETISGDGYRFGVVFRGDENLKLYPEAFVFDLFAAIESGTAGGSYFQIEPGSPLTLVKSTGSRMGQIFTYEYEYNSDWGRLELVRETSEEYDRLSENQGSRNSINYDYWERPGMETCLGEFFVSDAQYQSYVLLKQNYQVCLDEGQYMLGCAQEYYEATDKLLNVEYQALRIMLDTNQKNELKTKQLAWLKKRDSRFAEIEDEMTNSGIGGNDAQMMIWDRKAVYVLERVIELMESQTKLGN